MKIEIKSYKTCAGRDGYAFSYNLYLDGKKAAEVRNEGCGGMNTYHWFDRSLEPLFLAHCVVIGRPIWDRWSAESASPPDTTRSPDEAFEEYCKWGEVMDMVLEEAVNKVAEDKALKKLCKGQVVWRLKSDAPGAWRTRRGDWHINPTGIEEHLKKTHGDNLVEIANKRFA
jgi:hypothetical protein